MNIVPLPVALAQINPTVGDLDANTHMIATAMRKAHAEGAHIVCFPELALTGYPPEDLLLKPGFVDANMHQLDVLREASKELSGLTSVIGFVDRDHDIYNAAAIIHEGTLMEYTISTNLPNYGVFDEKSLLPGGP